MVREIFVIKKYRDDPIVDKAIHFPPLQNLHLDLIENKKKLKRNLPPVPILIRPVLIPKSITIPTVTESFEVTKTSKSATKTSAGVLPLVTKKSKIHPDENAKMMSELGNDDSLDENQEEEEIIEDSLEESDGGEVEEGEVKVAQDEVEEVEEDDEYAGLTPEEREAKEREEYIWKFKLLKKKFRGRDIPEYGEHDDLNTMKISYERTIKDVMLDENVNSYRGYLVWGFYGVEYFCTHMMKVDMVGFAGVQIANMDRYDRLLVELGERSYSRWGSNLPVELRLVGLIIFQAGIFYAMKLITDQGGHMAGEMFKTMFNQNTPKPPEMEKPSPPDTKKKKMRGPSIKPEDIRKMTKIESSDEE